MHERPMGAQEEHDQALEDWMQARRMLPPALLKKYGLEPLSTSAEASSETASPGNDQTTENRESTSK